MNSSNFLCALLLLLFPLPALAQGLIHGGQFWSLNTLRGPLDEKGNWDYYLEIQPRLDFEDSERTRVLIRPAVIFNLDSDQTLWAGVLDLADADFEMREFRPWQQYQRVDRPEGVILLNRTRLEERIRQGESDLGIRIRHMLRTQIPIGDQKKWSVVVFDEIFLGLNENKSQPVRGFDQNRIFAGLRLELEHQLGLEFGYLNQYDGTRMNHVPFLTVGKVIQR